MCVHFGMKIENCPGERRRCIGGGEEKDKGQEGNKLQVPDLLEWKCPYQIQFCVKLAYANKVELWPSWPCCTSLYACMEA